MGPLVGSPLLALCSPLSARDPFMKTRLLLLLGLLCGTNALQAQELAPAREANRPKVPGILRLNVRERRPISEGSKEFETRERTMDWEVAKTAIIICDMWDGHYCRSAAQRVNVMAPKMNEVLNAARSRGVMIIHAPSGTVEMYADTAYRRRMQQAPTVKPPVQIGKWCDYNPERRHRCLSTSRSPPVMIRSSVWPSNNSAGSIPRSISRASMASVTAAKRFITFANKKVLRTLRLWECIRICVCSDVRSAYVR